MANRRERFKKLYPKRLKNAKWNIRSIGKLSERTNYVYEEEEVDEILSTLMFEIKAAISKFGSGSVEERFNRYIDIDLKHMKVIQETDPELYQYILQRLRPKGASLLEDYLKEKKEKASAQELFDPPRSDFLDVPSFLEQKDLDEKLESIKELSDRSLRHVWKKMREDVRNETTRELNEIQRKLDSVINALNENKFLSEDPVDSEL
ncbi:uncharacterized protein METZ01_LOCUS273767 [marine metagenome]|uniref:Uncharacterized protein n=1 Tax=marine metagenome TaxID=408172 RepID=A0A382KBL3_9ZZZZ